MFKGFNLPKGLLDSAEGLLKEVNEQDKKFNALLEEYGITTPMQLSEQKQVEFLKRATEMLGEGYTGLRKLKEAINLREYDGMGGGYTQHEKMVKHRAATSAKLHAKLHDETEEKKEKSGKINEVSNEAPNIQRLTLTQEKKEQLLEKGRRNLKEIGSDSAYGLSEEERYSEPAHGDKRHLLKGAKIEEEPVESMKNVKMVHQEEKNDAPFDPDKKPVNWKDSKQSRARWLARHALEKAKEKAKEKVNEESLDERHMTSGEMEKREKIVKSMKKGLAGFKERYGKRAKDVMYATATKQAMNEAEYDNEDLHKSDLEQLAADHYIASSDQAIGARGLGGGGPAKRMRRIEGHVSKKYGKDKAHLLRTGQYDHPDLNEEAEKKKLSEDDISPAKKHWIDNVKPIYKEHGLSHQFLKAVDKHVKLHGPNQVWNYHGSADGSYPKWFDGEKNKTKSLDQYEREKKGMERNKSLVGEESTMPPKPNWKWHNPDGKHVEFSMHPDATENQAKTRIMQIHSGARALGQYNARFNSAGNRDAIKVSKINEEVTVKEKVKNMLNKSVPKSKKKNEEREVKGGKTMTGQKADTVNLDPRMADGMQIGAQVKSGSI